MLVVGAALAVSSAMVTSGGQTMFVDAATPALADAAARSEGACWGDVDGDGRQDLFVTNVDRPSRMWKNQGNGLFSDIARSAGIADVLKGAAGCALLDADNDGDDDLFVTARSPLSGPPLENKLFRNDGGTFADVTAQAGIGMTGAGVAAADWGDIDGDGDLDVFVATRTNGRFRGLRKNALFLQTRPLRFDNIASRTGLDDPIGPQRAFLGSWIDYDADGDLDLLIALDFWGVEHFRNDAGTFVRVTTTVFPPSRDRTPGAPPNNPMGVAWGDYDNDGCLDVFISGINVYGQGGFGTDLFGDLASRLYRSTCMGTFTDVTRDVGLSPTGTVQWAANFVDFDNDGDLDLSVVAGNASQEFKYRPNRIKRFFKRPITSTVTVIRRSLLLLLPNAVAMSEWAYRAEAMVPAIGAEGIAAAMPNVLYRNTLVEIGKAKFVNSNDLLDPPDFGATLGSAWADFDNDGDLDWFVPNRGTPNRLYRNEGPVGNHLRVHLVGERQRDAIGAWVRLHVGDGHPAARQLRHLHVLDGFLSQSQLDPHFGVGDARQVDELWVRWPGTTTWMLECTRIPANRTVTITQGKGCTW